MGELAEVHPTPRRHCQSLGIGDPPIVTNSDESEDMNIRNRQSESVKADVTNSDEPEN